MLIIRSRLGHDMKSSITRHNKSFLKSGISVRLIATVVVVTGCQGDDLKPSERSTPPATATVPLGVHQPDELVSAAKDVVAFLQGGGHFDRINLADTIALYVSPEGGGNHVTLTRDVLADPANWKVAALGSRTTYSLVPPKTLTKLTSRVGRHFNCLDYPLSSRFEHLAPLPHVGIKLEPNAGSSCLQTWNLTLVFDPEKRPPTLVAAVYDQWEW